MKTKTIGLKLRMLTLEPNPSEHEMSICNMAMQPFCVEMKGVDSKGRPVFSRWYAATSKEAEAIFNYELSRNLPDREYAAYDLRPQYKRWVEWQRMQ